MKDYFLADDLSGALDAGAAFHRTGRRVRIPLTADGWTAGEDLILGVTTETRNAAPAAAAAVVRRVLAHGQAQGARLVYKKIDSTLRGAVAAEIAAVAEALPAARILFCPANPAVGRTVREGCLLVHGVPVHETEFARDPANPVRESDLRRLLAGAGGNRVVVADAATETDLAAAVARMAAEGGAWVAVGSGALAGPVAALDGTARQAAPAPENSPQFTGPILMLCGSAHPANRSQAALLARERGVPVHELRLTDPAAAVGAVTARLRSAGSASLLVEPARHDTTAVLRSLTAAATEIIYRLRVERLFITGGETACALCGALGVPELELEAELEPGLSLSRGGAAGSAYRFAIKPGGFGTEPTWLRAWDALNE